jgi:hypothetical protein
MIGPDGLTVKVTDVLPLPAEFVAITVEVVVADTAVGVPDIIPVVVSNDRPAGTAVLIDQLVAGPPVLAGVSELIAVPTV